MARLQILELPKGSGDDRPPFVLVVDQLDESLIEGITSASLTTAESIGARSVFAFTETVDIPANDTTAYLDAAAISEASSNLDDHDVRGAIAADMNKAREQAGLPTLGQRLADERTEITRDMYWLAKRKQELLDALGMDRTRDWDDIRNAAIGLRRERDSWAASAQRVRDLHRPVEHRGQTICWACSDYDFPGQTTDSPPVAYDQCSTLKALAGYPTPGQEQA